MCDLSNFFQITCHTRHQLACAYFVEIPKRQSLQMRESAAAHFGFDVDAQLVTPVNHDGHQARVHQVNDQQPHRGRDGQRQVSAGQQDIDEAFDRKREDQFEQPRNHGATKVEKEQRFPGAVVLKKLSQHV